MAIILRWRYTPQVGAGDVTSLAAIVGPRGLGVASQSFNAETGVYTFTMTDGSTETVDFSGYTDSLEAIQAATEGLRDQAQGYATAAGAAAGFFDFADLATLEADTSLTYTAGQPGTVVVGDIVKLRKQGWALQVLASGAVGDFANSNVTPVQFKVLPGALVFPSTGPAGDDAPNLVLGSYGAVDLPETTYGNIIAGPRNPDVSMGVGYRNRIGPATNLSVVLGGNNDVDALAAFIIGHHIVADVDDGGANHPIAIGTDHQLGGAYPITLGTGHSVFANKAAAIGGNNSRIGTKGSPLSAQGSFTLGGNFPTADGDFAFTLGGHRCSATADYAGAWGVQAIARYFATMTNGNGAFGGENAAQDNMTHRGRLRRVSTTAFATQLTLDGGSTTLQMPTNSLWTAKLLVSAYRTDAGGVGQTASYEVTFSSVSDASAATIKSSNVNILHEDVSGWNCDVIASALGIQVRGTGTSGATIQWSATFTIDEVRNLS